MPGPPAPAPPKSPRSSPCPPSDSRCPSPSNASAPRPLSNVSDEPVLGTPDARRDWKRWAAAAVALLVTGVVVYIPIDKKVMEERAHDAKRGVRQGVLLDLAVEGAPHTLELTWNRGRFAPILAPAPASGTTLRIKGRFGEETLSWNTELGAFGPGSAEVDPYSHYKLSLRLERENRVLWSDSAWAYGIHDSHGHAH